MEDNTRKSDLEYLVENKRSRLKKYLDAQYDKLHEYVQEARKLEESGKDNREYITKAEDCYKIILWIEEKLGGI